MHRIPQQRQVFVNFLDLGVDILGGIALRAHGREGKALQLGGPGRLLLRLVEQGPGRHGQEGDQDREE